MDLIVTSKDDLKHLIDRSVERAVARSLDDFDALSEDATKEWLTNKEAQSFLGLSKATLQRYRDNGILPYSKVRTNIYYRYDDLVAVLEEHVVS
jgi:hypothetical protein